MTSTSKSHTDILLLGATGFTGKLIVRYLAAHPDRHSFSVALGARSSSKLDAVLETIKSDVTFKKVIIDVGDAESVKNAVAGHAVVLNTVGPYYLYSTPVVQACAAAGVHYVDLTGEAIWVRSLIDDFDYEATQTGSIIVPSCGFDSVPSDIVAYLGAKTIGPLTVDTSTSAVSLAGGFSGGTISTGLTMMELVPQEDLKKSAQDWYLSPVKGVRSAPRSLIQSIYLPDTGKTIWGGFWMMGPHNVAIVQRTVGLHGLEERQDPKSSRSLINYGPNFKYAEFLRTPGRISAALLTITFGLTVAALWFLPPLRWVVKKILPPGAGPSEKTMQNGHFTLINVTKSEPDSNGKVKYAKSFIKGRGDPGYLCTAIMIAECALLLTPAQKPKENLTVLAKKGGLLTPITAFGDALIERLKKSGRFEFGSEIIEAKKSK